VNGGVERAAGKHCALHAIMCAFGEDKPRQASLTSVLAMKRPCIANYPFPIGKPHFATNGTSISVRISALFLECWKMSCFRYGLRALPKDPGHHMTPSRVVSEQCCHKHNAFYVTTSQTIVVFTSDWSCDPCPGPLASQAIPEDLTLSTLLRLAVKAVLRLVLRKGPMAQRA
jgi:hypothetical protein